MEDKPRILVADDSPTVTEILNYIFSEEGWLVDTAADGMEALLRFYANPPDLVVLDIEMPRMNGYQVCRTLKDDPEARSTPIIILTSRDLQSHRYRGMSSGADAYIVKDLEDDQLLIQARDLLKERMLKGMLPMPPRQVGEGEILQVVNRMLDQRLFEMTIAGELEALNAKVENFESAVDEVTALFARVFEFVVGGVLLTRGDKPYGVLYLLDGFATQISEDFIQWMWNNARKDDSTAPPQIIVKTLIRATPIFPLNNQLTQTLYWPLTAHNEQIGIIAMGGTGPLKFDADSRRLLEAFINRAAIVLDNALLLKTLGDRNKALAETLEKLKSAQAQLVHSEKLASLGQMLAGLVHEINNPLNFIAGNLEHLESNFRVLITVIDACIASFGEAAPDEFKRICIDADIDYLRADLPTLLSDIREGTTRTQQIIQDLRAFAGQDRGELTPCDLSRAIHSAVNILRPQWQGVCEVVEHCADLPPYECSSGQIGQAILNLISNAVQAVKESGRKGKVDVFLNRTADWVEIKVIDEGVGIAPENIDKIFQPFFTTRDVGQGMGLGLSMTYNIIKQHRGEIIVASEIGKGAAFTIKLPSWRLIAS